jgi:hypothetical protein
VTKVASDGVHAGQDAVAVGVLTAQRERRENKALRVLTPLAGRRAGERARAALSHRARR